MEAELITARLFRFRARRSLGLYYSLVSIVPILGTILSLTGSASLVIAGILAGVILTWSLARLWGFARFSKMQYSLDFLKGEKGEVYDEKGDRKLSFRRDLARFIAIVGPWFGYIIAIVEKHPFVAILFPVFFILELILIRALSSSSSPSKKKKKRSILTMKAEDWTMCIGCIVIAILAIIPGAPGWTWILASPIFLGSGIKSLYDAPKELALVAF
jgi:hypothetical protein